jgi:hypothetical protein
MSSEEEAEEYAKRWKEAQEKNAEKGLSTIPIAAPHGSKVTVKLEDSEKTKLLEEKVRDYEEKLTKIASKEFDRRVDEAIEEGERLGLDVTFISNPEELRAIQKQIEHVKAKKPNSRDIPLSAEQLRLNDNTGVNDDLLPFEKAKKKDVALTDLDFESQEEMIQTLIQVSNDRTHPKQKNAKELLGQLYGKLDLSNVRVSKEKQGQQIEKTDPETMKKILDYARGKKRDVI